jgi:hypothetical protein
MTGIAGFYWDLLNFSYLEGTPWSWSYVSFIYNYLYIQSVSISPLTLWVRIPLRWGVLDTTVCDKVCQGLATGRWFSPVSSTNNTNNHDIANILLKVALNTKRHTPTHLNSMLDHPQLRIDLFDLLRYISAKFCFIWLSRFAVEY